MALMSTVQTKFHESFGCMIGVPDVRHLGTTIAFFVPTQDVLDIRCLEQPFIHGGLCLGEGTEDHSVEFVREL